MKCGYCKKIGHNRRTCGENIDKKTKKKIKVKNLETKKKVEPKNNHKKNLIQCFSILIQYADAVKGKNAYFKKRSFNKIIGNLTSYEGEINSIDDVSEIFKKAGMKNPAKTLEKIKEYFETGTMKEVEAAKKNPRVGALQNLTKIYAIGPSKAVELLEKHGISTIEELTKGVEKDPSIINNKQKIGLKYFHDLEQRIPRSEIDRFREIVETFADEIGIELSINGSYRRRASTSGDIDILVKTKPEWSSPAKIGTALNMMIQKLKEYSNGSMVVETLAKGKKKFMGVVYIPGETTVMRHLDIIETTPEEYPFAQFYFTGSGGFNVKMRKKALKLGYSLNEYSMTNKKTKTPVKKSLVLEKIGKENFETESDIFKFLEIDYVEPWDRKGFTLSKLGK